jgi:hypothetical protein
MGDDDAHVLLPVFRARAVDVWHLAANERAAAHTEYPAAPVVMRVTAFERLGVYASRCGRGRGTEHRTERGRLGMRGMRRRRVGIIIVGALLLIAVALALWSPALPWTANHYGFALTGSDGLPYRIHHSGRDYQTSGMCAHADWCARQPRTCKSQAQLATEGLWPLRQVDQVNTLLGPSYPVLMLTAVPSGMTTTLLFVPYQGCYQVYALEGGP